MNELLFTANPAVRALGFTLVHSLWQAVLIAVVAAIFFKKTAQTGSITQKWPEFRLCGAYFFQLFYF